MALGIGNPFSKYVFIERSADRIRALEKLKLEFDGTRNIAIKEEECARYLKQSIPKIDWKRHRALIFLDPFGMQVRWDTIEMLAKTKRVEIFLNFPVGMAIQRLLLRRHEKFTAHERARLDEYFGASDWDSVLYKPHKTLFGDDTQKIENSGMALLRWYQNRLRTVFGKVSNAALIRNTRGGHLYYLLLASHNSSGVNIANDILSAGEIVR